MPLDLDDTEMKSHLNTSDHLVGTQLRVSCMTAQSQLSHRRHSQFELEAQFHSQFKSHLCKSHPHWWHFPVAVARDYSHLASWPYSVKMT